VGNLWFATGHMVDRVSSVFFVGFNHRSQSTVRTVGLLRYPLNNVEKGHRVSRRDLPPDRLKAFALVSIIPIRPQQRRSIVGRHRRT
jgi:hypothetical protein